VDQVEVVGIHHMAVEVEVETIVVVEEEETRVVVVFGIDQIGRS
jgi:hypothetical protein